MKNSVALYIIAIIVILYAVKLNVISDTWAIVACVAMLFEILESFLESISNITDLIKRLFQKE